MVGDDRQRSGRDGIRVKTLEKQVYRTRIGLQTMVANDRRGSGQPDISGVTFGVTLGVLLELPPVTRRLMSKISAKAACNPLEFVFPDLNSISYPALPN